MNIELTLLRFKNKFMSYLWPSMAAKQAKNLFLTPRRYTLKEWELEMERQGVRTSVGNGLSTISWGESDKKILLVHGWESRATQLSGFVEPLVKKGFQVVAMDGPAHGYSLGEQSNPYQFSKAIEYIYRKKGPFKGMVGHSMGGAAITASLREGVDPQKLVLISSPASIINVLERFSAFIGLTPKTSRVFIDLVEQEVGIPAKNLDTGKNMKGQEVKGLIVHDKDDIEVPYSDSLYIKEYWGNSSLVTTNGLGHRAIVRNPEIWEKVANFFK